MSRRTRLSAAGLLTGLLAWLTTGCGGLNTSHSVSPASFFLPGLLRAVPEARPDVPPTNSVALSAAFPVRWN
jgi:hypothetical protein